MVTNDPKGSQKIPKCPTVPNISIFPSSNNYPIFIYFYIHTILYGCVKQYKYIYFYIYINLHKIKIKFTQFYIFVFHDLHLHNCKRILNIYIYTKCQ
jgi:hypothetical protein